MADRLMLIRHAEKPHDDELGVDAHGQPAPGSLSVQGWQRAGALVRLFAPPDGLAPAPHLQTPQRIFAARPTPPHPSTRPRDTVAPLAEALGLAVDERFGVDDPLPPLADALHAIPGAVLLCWRHDELPALAQGLAQGLNPDIAVPPRWPDDRFDLVWVFERTARDWHFVQVPQRVLAGDRTRTLVRRVRKAETSGSAAGATR